MDRKQKLKILGIKNISDLSDEHINVLYKNFGNIKKSADKKKHNDIDMNTDKYKCKNIYM